MAPPTGGCPGSTQSPPRKGTPPSLLWSPAIFRPLTRDYAWHFECARRDSNPQPSDPYAPRGCFRRSRQVPIRLKYAGQIGWDFRTAKSSGTRCYALGPNCWLFRWLFSVSKAPNQKVLTTSVAPPADARGSRMRFYPRSIRFSTERPVDSMSAGVGGSASMVCRMARAVRAAPVTNSSSMR